MTKFGFRHQHATKKRTQCCREPRRLRHRRRDNDREQSEGEKQILILGRRNQPKHGSQYKSARDDQHRDRRNALDQGLAAEPQKISASLRQNREQHQDRGDGHVLHQKHSDGRAPRASRGLVPLTKDLNDDRRRAERERKAGRHGRIAGISHPPSHQRNQRRAHHDLRQSHAQGIAPHRPQPVERQFKPDREEKEDHTEFGQKGRRLGRAYQVGTPRADQDAGHKVTQHRTDLEPMEQRHDEHRRCEEHRDFEENDILRALAVHSVNHSPLK